MKYLTKIMLWTAFVLPGLTTGTSVQAQTLEVEQLLLNVEKLKQYKEILSDMKKGYDIVSKGYTTIKELSEGNFTLHKVFLDGLMEVSPAVRKYRRIKDIVKDQLLLVQMYKRAFTRFKRNGYFNPDELRYINRVYDRLFRQSLDNLDQLLMVVTAGKLRMSDAERLDAIDRIYADMQDKLKFLQHFNDHTALLALQRAKEKKEAVTLRQIYGLQKEEK